MEQQDDELLTTDEAQQVADLTKVEAVGKELYDWTMDRETMIHVQAEHSDPAREEPRGQIAVTQEDYARVPRLLTQPKRFYLDKGDLMMEVTQSEERRRYVFAWDVRPKRRMVTLTSMRIYRHTPRAQRPNRSGYEPAPR